MIPTATQQPKNVIVLLLDSLNRHELGAYGGTSFDTPNIDRLAARSLKFTNHHTGSLPCIPARHDILVGAWDFLWKPWGSIEIWEEAITVALRRAGVVTNLITDTLLQAEYFIEEQDSGNDVEHRFNCIDD